MTFRDLERAIQSGERIVSRYMHRSKKLRRAADRAWDARPAVADRLDREELAYRIKAAELQHFVEGLKVLVQPDYQAAPVWADRPLPPL